MPFPGDEHRVPAACEVQGERDGRPACARAHIENRRAIAHARACQRIAAVLEVGNLAATPGGNVVLTLISHGSVTLTGESESDSFTSQFRSVTHEFRKDGQDFSQVSLRLFSEARVGSGETCFVELRLHSVNGVWQFESFESICQPAA